MPRFVLALVVLGLGVACGGGGGDGGGASAEDEMPSRGITFTAKDYSFDPSEGTTVAGESYIELENAGAVEHDLKIDTAAFKITALAGQTKKLMVMLEPGTYDFYCSVAGHQGQGMEGKLTVR